MLSVGITVFVFAHASRSSPLRACASDDSFRGSRHASFRGSRLGTHYRQAPACRKFGWREPSK